MMGEVYYVDFLDRKLLRKEVGEEKVESIPDMPDQVVLDKLSYFSELVGSSTVALKVDATVEGVKVPSAWAKKQLTINFSHTFKPDDLKYDELGVSQTLSYKGREHAVKLPWTSVNYIGLTLGGKARTWEEGSPPSIITFPNTLLKKTKPEFEPEPPRRA